jgi:hypothetical protein
MKTIIAAFCLFTQALAQHPGRYEIRDVSLNATDSVSYYIVGEYPLIVGLADTTIQSHINQRIQSLIQVWIQDFRNLAAEAYSQNRNSPYRFPSNIELGYDRRGSPSDSVISLLFTNMGLVSSSAHDNTQYSTLTFDLWTGKLIELSDIFQPGSHYLDTLSSYCISALLAQKGTTDTSLIETDGVSPKLENFTRFLLEHDQLTIFFDPYQVDSFGNAPHGYEVNIAYESLRRILAHSGPLSVLSR